MSSLPPSIYLASNSPRRRELLAQIHVRFEVLLSRHGAHADPDASEEALPEEDSSSYVQRLALEKAQTGIRRISWRLLKPQPVLSADTAIELDGEIIGKPTNPEHAVAILGRLSGRSHRVLTAVAVADGEKTRQRLSVSEVHFRRLSEEEIRRYVASGESMDKAGAYAIQGRAAMFIEEIRGSYSGIMGLPLFET
ncbi:MAG: septum formation inhibitor Maf, partial [Zoogloea sp.]|nr:septum formation inhibitor Maf [Zoogloea sp.]